MRGISVPTSLHNLFSSKTLKKRLHARTKAGRAAKRKALLLETLESRQLMASDSSPMHNNLIAQDVNGDFAITPIDVLQVINAINRQQRIGSGEASALSNSTVQQPMVDVNNDGIISPIDALQVINRLRTGEGVGELAGVGVEIRNSSGTLITPTTVGGVPEYTVGLGEKFVVRILTRDLRSNPLGVFASFVDVNYATQGGSPTTEAVEVLWGELQTVNISSNVNGGNFTLTYGSQTTTAINFSSNAVILAANTQARLETLFGTGNVRADVFVRDDGSRDVNISFRNSQARQDITTGVVTNNLTSNNANPVTTTLTSRNDPSLSRVLFAAIDYPTNAQFVGSPFAYDGGGFGGVLTTVPNTRLVLDDLGGFTPGTNAPTLEDAGAFLNIIDTSFRAGSSAAVVDFTVGPSGDSAETILLFDNDAAIPDNLIEFPSPFRIRVAGAIQAVNDTFSVNENSGATTLDVRANDILTTGTSFTVTSVTQPGSGGSVAIVNGGSAVSFTPTTAFSGTAQFTYTITSNLGATSTATVTVNVGAVNDPPVAITTPISVAEDSGATNITPAQLFTPGPGEDTQTVSLSNVSLVNGQTGGTVSLQGGNVVFTPAADFNGNVVFVATGTDNGTPNQATTATFTVTVTPVNDAPTAISTSGSASEDTVANFSASQFFSPGPSNESGQTLVFASAVPDGSQPGGSIAVVAGQAVLTPAQNFSGTFVFVGVARDNGSPNADSAPSTITITINPVNDAPIAVNDTDAARFTVPGIPGQTNELDVLQNDSVGANDPGDAIRIVRLGAVSGPGSARGTVSISSDGLRVIYSPPDGLLGDSETFTYTIRDNGGLEATATAEVFVIPPVLPFAANDRRTVAESSGQLIIDVLSNDLANTGTTKQLVSISALTNPATGTLVLLDNGTPSDTSDDRVGFTPAANFNGNAVFTYVMTDTGSESDPSTGTVTITVTEVNQPPTAQNQTAQGTEDQTLNVPRSTLVQGATVGVGDSNQVLTVTSASLITSGAGSVSVVNENIVYTPAANVVGTVLVLFTISDNGTTAGQPDPKTATATLTISLAAVNDAPIPGNDSLTAVEDTARTIPFSTITSNDAPGPNFSDENSQTLSLTSVAMANASQGTIAINGSNVVFTPAANFNGTAIATYVVRDDGTPPASATGTITFTVSEVNDAPVPVAASRDGFVGVPLNINLTNELAAASRGAANESGQTVRVSRVIPVTGTNATRGTVVLNSDGTITYTAPNSATAAFTDAFDYEIIDNGTTNGTADFKTGIARISINVQPFQASTATGRIWIDDNNNSVYDSTELFVDGIEVTLSGQAFGSTTPISNQTYRTLVDGSFTFENLAPGTYTVSFNKPTFMLDAPEAEQLTFTIAAPGGQTATANFRVLGISNPNNALWESQLNNFYLRNGQQWSQFGYTALTTSTGAAVWNIHRGGYEKYFRSFVEFNPSTLTATVSGLFVRTVTLQDGRLQDELVQDTFTAARGQFLATRVEGGNYLIRVLALPSQLSSSSLVINRSDPYAPTPTVTAEGFGYSSVDRIFADNEWYN